LRFIFASYADRHKNTAHSPPTKLLTHPNSKPDGLQRAQLAAALTAVNPQNQTLEKLAQNTRPNNHNHLN
jgi:hypothetical protein